MKGNFTTILVTLTALAGFLLSCTIVRNDGAKAKETAGIDSAFAFSSQNSTFDPKEYADKIWEPVVVPRVESVSVDFHTLLAALQSDETAASKTYGFRLLEEGNLFNFAVKGTVKILKIDTTSMNGTASLDFAPFDGREDCLLSIGPIFRGTTLRDIQNTLSLNDVGNQVEFARLGRELNNKVRDIVLADIDFSQRIGAEAELLGAFTYTGKGSVIEIIPVRLNLSGE
jgi:predicted lipoprotein